MRKTIHNGKVIYEFGNCHGFILPEEALVEYLLEIIKLHGMDLSEDELQNATFMFGPHYGKEFYNFQDEISIYFPKRNKYLMYKKLCNKQK